MTVDHGDLARQAFDASALPSPPRTLENALKYITKLLSILPAAEQAGYVKGPAGGENVTALPGGTLVRISRVMYPDGQIYKVMSDAPNGQPQWHAEDVRPELYVPFAGPHVPRPDIPDPPPGKDVDLGPLQARIANLEQGMAQLHAAFAEVSKQIGALNKQLADLSTKPPALPPLPDYIGRVGPLTIISRPRT